MAPAIQQLESQELYVHVLFNGTISIENAAKPINPSV